MARVTVEDCLKNVKNRFELVIIAAKRARQLMRGKEPKVAWENDKPTVVALREIAGGFVQFNEHEQQTDNIHLTSLNVESAFHLKPEQEAADILPPPASTSTEE